MDFTCEHEGREGLAMRFRSTRRSAPTLGLSASIVTGLAPDGGLYVPESFPHFRVEEFDGLESLPDIGERLLAPFFEGDALRPTFRTSAVRLSTSPCRCAT